MLRPYRGTRSIEQNDGVAFVAEGNLEDAGSVVQNAKDPDDRGGVDGLAEGFVVEADVSAGDGRAESLAGFGEAVDSLRKLPHHFGFLGATEIEAIRRGDGARAASVYVAGGFRNSVHRAQARLEVTPPAVALN